MVRNRKVTESATKHEEEIALRTSAAKKVVINAKSIGDRIREAREAIGITQEELAKQFTRQLEVEGLAEDMPNKGRGRSSIAQWETGRANPEFKTIAALARSLKVTSEFLAFGVTGSPKTVAPDPEELGYVMVPEITVESEAKFKKHQIWGLPVDFLRSELGVTSFKDIAIFKVEVDCAPYEYGDRVIIDRVNFKPSPPGHFLYWDGMGANIAKMMVVPSAGKKPKVRVKGASGDFETDIDKITIIGRVKGVWKKG